MSEERGFTGWFIPVELVDDYGLSAIAALLWSEIHALGKRPTGCTAGNEHFAKSFGLSENRISLLIKELKAKGLVKQEAFDGRTRTLRPIAPWLASDAKAGFAKTQRGVCENVKPEFAKTQRQEASPYRGKEEDEGRSEVKEKAPLREASFSRPRRNRSVPLEPSEDARQMIQSFAESYRSKFKAPYAVEAKTDVPAAMALLASGRTTDEVIRLFDGAMACKGWHCKQATTLPNILKHWRDLVAEIAIERKTTNTPDKNPLGAEWLAMLEEEQKERDLQREQRAAKQQDKRGVECTMTQPK